MNHFKIYRYPLCIKEYHLDTFGHVNNAKYLELFEEARWEFLNEEGITLESIQKKQIGPVVLEFTIQFLKELTLRQKITIESQLINYDNKIGAMSQCILNEQNEFCCKAKMTFGIFNMATRKLIPPPDEWLKAVGHNLRK